MPDNNPVLERMLERLFNAIISGPSMDCRPHHSRQRLDLTTLDALDDLDPNALLAQLLEPDGSAKLHARIQRPQRDEADSTPGPTTGADSESPADDERERAKRAWTRQQAVLRKLRLITEDARTYEQDTGVYVLNLGFPLLHLPKGADTLSPTRKVLAPLAFIPLTMSIASGAKTAIEFECRFRGADRVVPNDALLAWIEQRTGVTFDDLDADEGGDDPWGELAHITRRVAAALEVTVPTWAVPPPADNDADADANDERTEPRANEPPARPPLVRAPDTDDATTGIVASAALGLYPVSNQGLVRDTQRLLSEGIPDGPIESFLRFDANLTPTDENANAETEQRVRDFSEERFVQLADPCQARAIRLARDAGGVVIHGPPGTGKSQTITNIIGDHLARGERVLFVCDKRTALDVVANRLRHIGLGDLCALVHDAQRDQRDLYMDVRRQLESLTDTHPATRAEDRVDAIDTELQRLHNELLDAWRALMLEPDADHTDVPNSRRAAETGSFHELVGRWLALDVDDSLRVEPELLADAGQLETRRADITGTLQRGLEIDWVANPWPEAVGVGLDGLLAQPADRWRDRLERACDAAEDADARIDSGLSPFRTDQDPVEQGDRLAALAGTLDALLTGVPAATRIAWTDQTADTVERAAKAFGACAPQIQQLREATQDAELDQAFADERRPAVALSRDLVTLEEYQAVAKKWWSFLAFGKKGRASEVLRRYGLRASAENAERLIHAIGRERARLAIDAAVDDFAPSHDVKDAPTTTALLQRFDSHVSTVNAIAAAASTGDAWADRVRAVLREDAPSGPLDEAMRAAPARANAIATLRDTIRDAGLFSREWTDEQHARACAHEPAQALFKTLADRFATLEESLRVRTILDELPAGLSGALERLLASGAAPDDGIDAIERAHIEATLAERVRQSTDLQRLDGRRLETSLARMAELQREKMDLVRTAVAARWLALQREQLLVGTGSRLNTLGAGMKRRLLTRGRRALRLRQVIHHGTDDPNTPDPLFNLKPIWMASPETVAQVFPRTQMFDVVIFDEASQCRLEETLPVLTRAKRVVIAGDPKQLPPTRFFETALTQSDDDLEITSDQDLFEAQQSEVEDLLTAALGLEIEQAYLDVHYRSRNADLIEFSNEQFYNDRLQPIPGHPGKRARHAPLTLTHAGGTFHKGENETEARRVVEVVRELLDQPEPPSIGVACFNVSQRDLILECFEDAAEHDRDFARKLADARARRGDGSFEGLFVKNLENVQGDERDHIVISTTYGPNDEGRFYKRFGPLIQAGGGRRLNVLVTRARSMVHLVTSIPPEHYRAIPPIPAGQTAGGAWLLFAYLSYAERLTEAYATADAKRAADAAAEQATVLAYQTHTPSPLTEAFAQRTAARGVGSELYWGNDGFCIDLALEHPTRAEDVTLGVMADLTRFNGASDPIEWELFRTGILEWQGWTLHRVWSPAIFRDQRTVQDGLTERVRDHLADDTDPEALRVWEATHG